MLFSSAGGARGARKVLTCQRGLFKSFKNTKLPQISTKDADTAEVRDHEYSIRPDTFAFKVSASNERRSSLAPVTTTKDGIPAMTPHPFQTLETEHLSKSYNPVRFIYQNATNYPFKTRSPQEVFSQIPNTNAAKLARSKNRPIRVKMLVSDFIDNSLYNPHYGYFSREVEIFHTEKPFKYNEIKDVDEFMENWKQAYSKYDKSLRGEESTSEALEGAASAVQQQPKSSSTLANAALEVYRQDKGVAESHLNKQTKRSLQLWHTPTELFLPFYGEAIARYILDSHISDEDPVKGDLVIFEMGGGNGTLMCNILNYIKQKSPVVYARTKYNIIEISNQLAQKQFEQALSAKLMMEGLQDSKVNIINQSIFEWEQTVDEKCFFVALEVFDNFSHDLIRYDNNTGQPLEGHVLIDEKGDFYEFFTPELSYYSNAYLQLRENGDHLILKQARTSKNRISALKSAAPFLNSDDINPLHRSSTILRWKHAMLPLKDNMTPGEFIPTRLLQFFHILKHRFPNHSIICSDFHQLPKTIKGYHNGPVVQTVLQNRMIDTSTYMCYPGYFDIMFATDFQVMSSMYRQVTGKVPHVETHREFLEQWAAVEATNTKTGENPMLDFYRNVSFMTS